MTIANKANKIKYVTLSFQNGGQSIFDCYEPFEAEFDSSDAFTGTVSLTNGYDPELYESNDWDGSDTEINFAWKSGSGPIVSNTIITDLNTPDELAQLRQISGIEKAGSDRYVIQLSNV